MNFRETLDRHLRSGSRTGIVCLRSCLGPAWPQKFWNSYLQTRRTIEWQHHRPAHTALFPAHSGSTVVLISQRLTPVFYMPPLPNP